MLQAMDGTLVLLLREAERLRYRRMQGIWLRWLIWWWRLVMHTRVLAEPVPVVCSVERK